MSTTEKSPMSQLQPDIQALSTAPEEGVPSTPTQAGEQVPASPAHTFAELGPLFAAELRRNAWADAYLYARAMGQIAEDYLHRNPPVSGRAGVLSSAIAGLRSRSWSARHVVAWQALLAGLVRQLADAVAAPAASFVGLGMAGETVIATMELLPPALLQAAVDPLPCTSGPDLPLGAPEHAVAGFAERRPDTAPYMAV